MAWKYAVFSVMCPDGIEWRVTKKAPEPIKEISYWSGNRSTVDVDDIEHSLPEAKKIADAHNLEMPILGTYLRCHEHDMIERVMKVAADVACPQMRIGTPPYDGSRPYPELYDETVKDYAKVALAEKYGVRACIEMHMDIITPSAGLTHRVVSHFDPAQVGVIFDPANMVVEGYEECQMALELLGPYLAHVHAKNCLWEKVGEKDGVAQWAWKMAAVKEGQIDWTKVYAALKKVGYDGWVSFEDFSDGDTKEKLTEALAYLKGLEKSA